nr:immunoglobulin heavy chain junction region [Mus musculus]
CARDYYGPLFDYW